MWQGYGRTARAGATGSAKIISYSSIREIEEIKKQNQAEEKRIYGKISKDLEFIEIKNTGSETVNLSGIYLRELGTSYQFPFDSTVGANESLYLTSNLVTFQSKYGFPAFGQYSRNFSDKTQKIVLADAYGNVIDKVEYSDASPWPTDADGKGSYLGSRKKYG